MSTPPAAGRRCETLQLWDERAVGYPDLAEDIAAEARLALALCTEIRDLEQKIAALLHQADPAAIMTSVPGVGVINGAQILARLGDPARFQSLAGARSFSGLVPSLTASGVNGRHGPPTKSGDAPLREALFMAANPARRTDPTLAARYHRLMVHQGKHHNSALCHISTPCSPASSPAGGPAPPTSPRHRRHPPHHRRRPRHHRRALPHLRPNCAPSAAPATPRRGRAATPGVARRSDTSPPPHHATTTSPNP